MLGFGSSQKIAELEEALAALTSERDVLAARVTGLSARVKSLSDEVVRLRPYAGILDAEREIERRERERQERERRLAMRPSVIRFTYCDADFETTTRTAEIKYLFDGPEGPYMRCFCHLRGDERTFRLDRIRGDIINVQTGELLKPWQLAALYDKQY